MRSGDIGCAVETKNAVMNWPHQEKWSGRTNWLNLGTGSFLKTSSGTSEKKDGRKLWRQI